ncbi:MAG TPA: hypothetical protein GX717_08500 [Clostridiaceae bacterium]|nr:hypothetical protein [Clostridiaceae bacterium]
MANIKEDPIIYPNQDGRHLPGAKFMKVIGILAIIFGAISILTNVLGLIGINSLINMSESSINEMQDIYGADLMAQIDIAIAQRSSIVMQIIGGTTLLVTGILGLIFHKKLKLATPPLIGGIVTIILILITNILSMSVAMGFVFAQIISLILSCAVPALMIVACIKKDRSLRRAKRVTIDA